MTTRQMIEQELLAMPADKFAGFFERYKSRGFESIASKAQAHIVAKLLVAYDNNEGFALDLCRQLNIPTQQEQRDVYAARQVNAAEESASAARLSAEASEKAERHAKSSARAAWWSVIASAIAVLISAVHALIAAYTR